MCWFRLNKWSINIAECCPAALCTTQQMVYNSALWYSLDQGQSSHTILSLCVLSHTPTHTHARVHKLLILDVLNVYSCLHQPVSSVRCCQVASQWPQNVIVGMSCLHRDIWAVSFGAGMDWPNSFFSGVNSMSSGLKCCLHHRLKIAMLTFFSLSLSFAYNLLDDRRLILV